MITGQEEMEAACQLMVAQKLLTKYKQKKCVARCLQNDFYYLR